MPMTDAQYDELLGQIDRAGKSQDADPLDKPLGPQVRPVEECFSMWTAIKRHFFPNQ